MEQLRKNAVERKMQFVALFGRDPIAEFPQEALETPGGCPLRINVLVFRVASEGETAVAAVTSGMSDYRMTSRGKPETWIRREVIQYLDDCSPEAAKQLAYLAWLPHFDEILVDESHTVDGRGQPNPHGTWRNAFFVSPIIEEHEAFRLSVAGESASLISYVPISDEELIFKRRMGHQKLLERMDERQLPWVFNAKSRKPLVGAEEVLVPVFIPSLASVLQSAEQQKGTPLEKAEVLHIRDKAVCMMMTLADARKMAESRGYGDVDPDYCWQQWLDLRSSSGD